MAVDRIAQLAVDIVINTRRARAQLSNFRRDLGQNTKAVNRLSTGLGTIGLAASGILLIRKAFGLLTEGIKANILAFADFEKQIIDIQKVSDLPIKNLTEDFFELGKSISGVSFKEIGDTMASAARLGIPGGVKGLAAFTDTAVKLAQVSDDIDSINAAQGLGRLIVNFKLTSEEANNVAAGINELSNNFAVTAGQILTSSARLAGFANAVEITVDELNGLVAFLVKSGQTSTVTRSSLTKLFNVLVGGPIKAAEALKLPKEELENFISARTVDRVRLFFNAFKQKNVLEQRKVLEDLGIAGARVAPAIFAVANDLESLDKALKISAEATAAGTSLLDKHAKVAGTTTAQITDLGKEFQVLTAFIINATGILDIFTGSLAKLNEALGIDKKIEIKVSDLPSTIRGLKFAIKLQKGFVDAAKRAELKADIAGDVGLLASIAGFLGFGVRAGAGVAGADIRGQREQSQKKLALLEEKLAILTENRSKKEETIVNKEKKDAETSAAAKKRVDDAAAFQNAQFLEDLKGVSFGLKGFEAQIDKLNIKFDETTEEFDALIDPTREVRFRFNDLRREIVDAVKAIREQQAEARAAKLDPFLGKIGQAVNLLDQFQDALKLGIPGLAADLRPILNRQLEGLFNQERQPNAFIGLTEAWKKAQLATNKENPLLELQIELARRQIEIEGRPEADRKEMINVLNQIRDQVGQGQLEMR